MKLLLHICCAPCSIYPIKVLRQQGCEVTGYWFNPNIHPYREFRRRLDSVEEYAKKVSLPLIVERDYDVISFLRKTTFQEQARCGICYRMRLEETARLAAEKSFPFYTTTLFYSKYQNHKLMQSIGKKMAEKYGVKLLYEDFSVGWQEGIDCSIEENMYRQAYCGCIYSEQERYDNRWKKRQKKKFKKLLTEKEAVQEREQEGEKITGNLE